MTIIPFDSLREGDSVTLRGVVAGVYQHVVSIDFIDANGDWVDNVSLARAEYEDCAISSVERAS